MLRGKRGSEEIGMNKKTRRAEETGVGKERAPE